MKFYIVTPCFNAMEWLPMCIRSVADQADERVEVHHHIQDGGSSDGTVAFLEAWAQAHDGVPGYRFTYESGRDDGMYDALNLAWDKLPDDADVTAHINSDEQYLPGALSAIARSFELHPAADIVETSFVFVDRDGHYRAHRRPAPTLYWTRYTVCQLATCATFHRASVFRTHGIRYDKRFRIIGDIVFCRDLIARRSRVRLEPSIIASSFTDTGENMAWNPRLPNESALLRSLTPKLYTALHPVAYRCVNVQRRILDFFCAPPKALSLYHRDEENRRKEEILRPTCRYIR